MTRSWMTPALSDDWALFLDLDGTLLEIAPTPDAVQVTPDLPSVLATLRQRLQGALALVSGRAISDLDALLHPLQFPAAGIHGIERRDAQGDIHLSGLSSEDLDPARAELLAFVATHPGTLLEDKGRALALHFRQAPELAVVALQAAERLLTKLPKDTRVQPGHCVVEIKGGRANKYSAIQQFMQELPFSGRVPVFVGDDLTDRDGFAYVESVGGHAIVVGPEPEKGRGWLPNPAAVRDWLRSACSC
jgi:trehalose 6-phosphate phosphatase